MAEPTCSTQPRSTGFIHLQQMISGYPAWTGLWCVLRQHHLRCWTYPEDVGRQLPVKTVDLTKEMSVENAPRLTMRRPNTLLIKDHETDSEFFVSFESKEEREKWATVLRQAIVDLKVWKESSNYIIQKQSSKFYNENDFDALSGYSPYKRNNPLSQYKHTAETTVL